MSHKFIVYPYKMASQSAKALAQGLEAKRVFPNGRYRPRSNHIIINWGNSERASWGFRGTNLLNYPDKVAIACNKLFTFEYLDEASVSIPSFVTQKELALALVNEGHKVFCRTSLTGHSGQGIVLATTPEEVVNAPLYTKYTKCKYEYRVHVFKDQIIDFIRKKKREGVEANQYIRSCNNGWVFCREGVELPECVKEQALKAIQALGLDFGAVDIGFNTREEKAYVYEVNSAPGLEGTTLQRYIQAFKEYANDN